jgi:polyhydroxyalkanoate synthesis regulator phasin
VNARTALEEDSRHRQDPDEVLRRTLAVLVEEGEMATEEARRYQEELGIAVEPEE